MKPKLLVTILALALCGCAGTPENKLAWEVKPVMDIRHGMANAAASYQLGRYHQNQGRLVAAEEAYDKALQADPKSVDALNALGALYAERGELERAAAAYQKVAELTPQRAYLFNNIGYALYLQGRYAEAIDALRQAVTLDSKYERAWVNLQKVAEKADMPEIAAQAARRAPETLASAPTRSDESLAVDTQIPQQMSMQLAQVLRDQPNLLVTSVTPPKSTVVADIKQVRVRPHPANLSGVLVLSEKNRHPVIRMSDAVSSTTSARQIITMREGFETARASVQKPAMAAVEALQVLLPASPPLAVVAPAIAQTRIEVSNANGVNGYASHVRAVLRREGFSVTRLTNFRSFNLPGTTIEYRSGFADAAWILKDKLGRNAQLREMQTDRPGTDVRLVVGRDWSAPARTLSAVEAGLSPAT